MNANKIHREKTRWEIHKNATSYLEQILETIAVQPLISHFKNHPSKTNNKCRTLLEKLRWIHEWHSSMDPYTWTYQADQQEQIYISSVWTQDVIWETCQKRWMIGMDRKSIKKIHTVNATWWWFSFQNHLFPCRCT